MNKDIGIDIGTKNTYIYAAAHGNVTCEPSSAAVDIITGSASALGLEARRLVMRTPGCNKLVYPLADGSAGIEFQTKLLGYHVATQRGGKFIRPKVAVTVPPDISEEDEALLTRTVLDAGASEAVLIEAPLAAAVGAGLDVYTRSASLVIDAGASKTTVAVIAGGKVEYFDSVSIGGTNFDRAICDYIRNKYRIAISEDAAEGLKIIYASLGKRHSDKTVSVSGTAMRNGLPLTVELRASELSAAILVPAMEISDIICACIDRLDAIDPEYKDDIRSEGIIITGGAGKLNGFAEFIAAETAFSASVADNAGACAAIGLGLGIG